MDQIALCYTSMDLSKRDLQNNEKLFSNYWPKTVGFSKCVNIDQSAMYISYIYGFDSTSSTN